MCRGQRSLTTDAMTVQPWIPGARGAGCRFFRRLKSRPGHVASAAPRPAGPARGGWARAAATATGRETLLVPSSRRRQQLLTPPKRGRKLPRFGEPCQGASSALSWTIARLSRGRPFCGPAGSGPFVARKDDEHICARRSLPLGFSRTIHTLTLSRTRDNRSSSALCFR
eukprot:scaffold158_cov388-Prasinococcus_capsulatus_cf.AAC.16